MKSKISEQLFQISNAISEYFKPKYIIISKEKYCMHSLLCHRPYLLNMFFILLFYFVSIDLRIFFPRQKQQFKCLKNLFHLESPYLKEGWGQLYCY